MSSQNPGVNSPEYLAFLAEQDRQAAQVVHTSDPDAYLHSLGAEITDPNPGMAFGPEDTPKTLRDFKEQHGGSGGGPRQRQKTSFSSLSAAEIARARSAAKFNIRFEIPEMADPETGDPFVALIRQPDMMMLMAAGAVPSHLRRQVNDFLQEKGDSIKGSDGDFDQAALVAAVEDDLLGTASEVMAVADIIAVNSFMEPKLCWTEAEEIADPINLLWYERIDASARQRLFAMMKNVQEEGQKAVATFPVDADEVVRSHDPIEIPVP